MICNCTLAGTDACNNCVNNLIQKASDVIVSEIKINSNKKGFPVVQYWCSECEASLDKYDKYCHNCGIEINWEKMIDD